MGSIVSAVMPKGFSKHSVAPCLTRGLASFPRLLREKSLPPFDVAQDKPSQARGDGVGCLRVWGGASALSGEGA